MKKKKASNIVSGKATLLSATKCLRDCFPKSTSKPATILYKKLPDNMILITGFENFKTTDEIFMKHGITITKTYSGYPYAMTGDVRGVMLTGLLGCSLLTLGYRCSKKDFSKIIAHVKKCGALLHDIIQACEKGEVKRIEI